MNDYRTEALEVVLDMRTRVVTVELRGATDRAAWRTARRASVK